MEEVEGDRIWMYSYVTTGPALVTVTGRSSCVLPSGSPPNTYEPKDSPAEPETVTRHDPLPLPSRRMSLTESRGSSAVMAISARGMLCETNSALAEPPGSRSSDSVVQTNVG